MNEIMFCDPEVPLMNIPGSVMDKLNKSNNSIHIMDNEHRCYFVNDYWKQLHQLNKQNVCIEGLPYAAIPHNAFYTCSDRFEEHDQEVFKTGKMIPSLEIHHYDSIGGWMALLLTVKPIEISNKCCGLVGEAKPLPEFLVKNYQKMRNSITSPGNTEVDYKLLLTNPDRLHDAEFDTVYLLMLGLKPKQIAARRNISVYTVYSTLANIKVRFGLNKPDDIVEFGIEQGWHDHVPHMFRETETTLQLGKAALGFDYGK